MIKSTALFAALLVLIALPTSWAAVYVADPFASSGQPDYYRDLADRLGPGDTLKLPAGTYRDRLNLTGLNGTSDAWITITGPESGSPAIITTESTCCNTVQLGNNSYVALKNLTVDSAGIDAIDGINAKSGFTHDILIENCRIIGQDSHQQTVGISTKSPAWNWNIRHTTITNAGTGLYLGDSSGNAPFIAGIIEGNLIVDTIGYNMQIKHQKPYSGADWVDQLPVGPQRTIIRNNVFIKRKTDWPANKLSGARPNVLVGVFPDSGRGSEDLYEIYANFFYMNRNESLLQMTGRAAIHDNIFINEDIDETAIYVTDHNGAVSVAHIYNNTIYSKHKGISFRNQPRDEYRVIGNMIFSDSPLQNVADSEYNLTDSFENSKAYVNNPSMNLGQMNFYPKVDCVTCNETPLNLSAFNGQLDYERDFNGTTKGDFSYRGAYAGSGNNPGWQLNEVLKVGGPSQGPSDSDSIAPSAPTELTID